MKKLFALAAVFMFAFTFSACGNPEDKPDGDNADKTEHTHSYTEKVIPATCTEKGYTLYTCACGESYRNNESNPLNHSFLNYVSDENATCTENGTKTAKCERCEETDTVTENKLGHKFKDGKCERCGTDFFSEELSYTQSADGKSYSVTGIGECKDAVIVVPAEYDGLPVTAVGAEAFSNCAIREITLPDSVTEIGGNAFDGCPLEKATVPAAAAPHIGNPALKTAIITSGEALADRTFENCASLTGVTLPEDLKNIGENAFSHCASLIAVKLPDGLESVGGKAFSFCNSLKEAFIPDGVATIGDYAFSSCNSLTGIRIPDGVMKIGYNAFNNKGALTVYCEAPVKPEGWHNNWVSPLCPLVWNCRSNDKDINGFEYFVTDGIKYALKDGTAAVAIQPDNITAAEIAEKITYKDKIYTVTKICDFAFRNCSQLTRIAIPVGITEIGENALLDCASLTDINYAGTKAEWNEIVKPVNWDGGAKIYAVHCADGDVPKN